MIHSVLAGEEIQKIQSLLSAECERRLHWVTVTPVLYFSQTLVRFIVVYTWDEKAD